MTDWLDEINLGLSGPPVSMGIRKLGNRPWLFTDEKTKDELALKMKLSGARFTSRILFHDGLLISPNILDIA